MASETVSTGCEAARTAREEAALVARARAGDRDALAALVSSNLAAVYGVTARILGDRELAADAAQDAFVNALGALHRFRGEASFRTWLLRIAVNAARGLARRRGRRREFEVALEAAANVAAEHADPAMRVALGAEAERVERALARLPEKQRLAVTLRVYHDLSYGEISAVVGCSEGAARVNYHLGIKRLRELLR
ncbi:MAG TPA: RNA polymerase sigma factor [Longimicrobiales bacterium]